MQSALYHGSVRHRRFAPVPHAFRYRLFMLYLDLGEIDQVFATSRLWSTRRWAPARFRREDFHGDPASALLEGVKMGRGGRSASRRPLGSAMPQTVPVS